MLSGESTPPLTPGVIAAFAVLTLALASLWWPGTANARNRPALWTILAGLAMALATAAGLVDGRGGAAVVAFAIASLASRATSHPFARGAAHLAVLAVGGALFLHLLPGFENPRVIANATLGPGALPYTKYLNVDKGMAALLLLGLYVPDRTRHDEGLRHPGAIAWRFGVLAVVVLALSLALGYVRWDPKLPAWWPVWLWSTAFLTALPEEAVFRGALQEGLRRELERRDAVPRERAAVLAIVVAGVLFGLAHVAGGPAYVALATVSGMGYGWVYASTRSFAAAIVAHTALNTLHLLLFTYPALATALAR